MKVAIIWHTYLVGGITTPLKNMKVSWDYNFQIFPIYGKIKHVPLTLKIIWVKDRVSKIAERHEKNQKHTWNSPCIWGFKNLAARPEPDLLGWPVPSMTDAEAGGCRLRSNPGLPRSLTALPFLLVEAQLHCWLTKIKSNSREIPLISITFPWNDIGGPLCKQTHPPKNELGVFYIIQSKGGISN